jgi:hypothetical protein
MRLNRRGLLRRHILSQSDPPRKIWRINKRYASTLTILTIIYALKALCALDRLYIVLCNLEGRSGYSRVDGLLSYSFAYHDLCLFSGRKRQ